MTPPSKTAGHVITMRSMPLTLTPGTDGRVDPLLEPGSDGRLGVARVESPVRGQLADGVAWILIEGGVGGMRVGDDRQPRRGS